MIQKGGTWKIETMEASVANQNNQDKTGHASMEVIDLESTSLVSFGTIHWINFRIMSKYHKQL